MAIKGRIFLIPGIILIIVAALFIIFGHPYRILEPGDAGVVFNIFSGMETRILKPGINIVLPVIERCTIYSSRLESYTLGAESAGKNGDEQITALTADGQPVRLDITVTYSLNVEQINLLHSKIGADYMQKLLIPSLRTVVRLIISKYTAVEIYSSNPQEIATTLGLPMDQFINKVVGRIAVQNDMTQTLKNELTPYYIVVDSILLRNISFSPEFQSALEKKLIAQQEASQKLIAAEAEKKAKIIIAEGNAEAMQKMGNMLKLYPEVISFTYVDKLAPNVQTIITNEQAMVNVGGVQPSFNNR